MYFYSVRGATCIKNNDKNEIDLATRQLLLEIMAANGIEKDQIVQIIFSATRDITKMYPAEAARNMGIVDASLLCLQEMYVEGSLPFCIRILMNFSSDVRVKVKHVYLNEAKKLRPDLQ